LKEKKTRGRSMIENEKTRYKRDERNQIREDKVKEIS